MLDRLCAALWESRPSFDAVSCPAVYGECPAACHTKATAAATAASATVQFNCLLMQHYIFSNVTSKRIKRRPRYIVNDNKSWWGLSCAYNYVWEGNILKRRHEDVLFCLILLVVPRNTVQLSISRFNRNLSFGDSYSVYSIPVIRLSFCVYRSDKHHLSLLV